ncbi:hypothetical protein SAMN05661096_02558 [Marivirga sericea]|uniref:Uncharacterized protein n=1 Tax=Marivirga sericea TaxID=1028 RepID=A0A1X7KCP5_9BACT|nr:hypothetical protein [Marivirga sericea]SMG38680.1 hypothetical protein SAMN05661096_02558 [Marivirga sericea]
MLNLKRDSEKGKEKAEKLALLIQNITSVVRIEASSPTSEKYINWYRALIKIIE